VLVALPFQLPFWIALEFDVDSCCIYSVIISEIFVTALTPQFVNYLTMMGAAVIAGKVVVPRFE
jgi:hypothetical protein